MRGRLPDGGPSEATGGWGEAGTASPAATQSAVLVPLQIDDGSRWRVTFIRRTEGPHRHAGQVAFPGGRHEQGRDESLLDTALREMEEEIGADRTRVTVLGALSERRTFSSNFTIVPYVGRLPFPCRFSPCSREVSRVFSVPLDRFAAGMRRDRVEWTFDGRSWALPCVRAAGEVIWGVTLEILEELMQANLIPRP
jgi:8-oxo-dGTP pyrophosphatase MutT (NUDIX family)